MLEKTSSQNLKYLFTGAVRSSIYVDNKIRIVENLPYPLAMQFVAFVLVLLDNSLSIRPIVLRIRRVVAPAN